MNKKRPQSRDANERPADLWLWLKDGELCTFAARVDADTTVEIGRTNSKRALGFLVIKAKKPIADFVLDRDQVAELAAYLRMPSLRKPPGRKPANAFSLAATKRGVMAWRGGRAFSCLRT